MLEEFPHRFWGRVKAPVMTHLVEIYSLQETPHLWLGEGVRPVLDLGVAGKRSFLPPTSNRRMRLVLFIALSSAREDAEQLVAPNFPHAFDEPPGERRVGGVGIDRRVGEQAVTIEAMSHDLLSGHSLAEPESRSRVEMPKLIRVIAPLLSNFLVTASDSEGRAHAS